MKKLVLTLTAALACTAAFAQGKVLFQNDTLHLVYFSTSTANVLAGDTPGSALPTTGKDAAGDSISVDLWYGTSSSSLAKLITTSMANGPFAGVNPSTTAVVPASGTQYFFQFQVYSTAAGSVAAAMTEPGMYYGESSIFTCTGGSFAPTPLTGPAGTWAAGTVPVTGSAVGGMGAISLQALAVPEPTSLALLGLGSAGLLIFRRRK